MEAGGKGPWEATEHGGVTETHVRAKKEGTRFHLARRCILPGLQGQSRSPRPENLTGISNKRVLGWRRFTILKSKKT